MRICFDFDGVIHSFVSPWLGDAVIPDPPVAGCRETLALIKNIGAAIVVHSHRCRSLAGREAIAAYMGRHQMIVDEIVEHKPVADLYVDDRAVPFQGGWQEILAAIYQAKSRASMMTATPSELIQLHLHARDGQEGFTCDWPAILRNCRENQLNRVALTNLGSLHGLAEFYREALDCGMTPIIGCEFFITENRFQRISFQLEKKVHQLVLLAQSLEGVANLLRLDFQCHIEGYFHVPRIDLDLLACHSDGLVCLSGCSAGLIPDLLRQGEIDQARWSAQRLQEIFAGRFFSELLEGSRLEQKMINAGLVGIANELGIPMLACDSHHPLVGEVAEFFVVENAASTGQADQCSPEAQIQVKISRQMREVGGYCSPDFAVGANSFDDLGRYDLSPEDFSEWLATHRQAIAAREHCFATTKPLAPLTPEKVRELNELFAKELAEEQTTEEE